MNKLHELKYTIEHDYKLRSAKQIVLIVVGNLMLALTMNYIVTPYNLYCSGAMGVAQLVTLLLTSVLHLPELSGISWLGIIYWGINIPVLLYGAKSLGKKFFFNTIISITVLSLFIAIIPVADVPIIHNEVMGCIAAGVFGGIGVGFVLTGGSGCGAGDVIGMVMASTKPGFSVGLINMIINVCIYTICAFLYGLENAVYSIFYAAILSWAMDKYHSQNHYIQITVYSKLPDIANTLSIQLNRGVTTWKGEGGFTKTPTTVVNTIVTRHESDEAIDKIKRIDQNAFISQVEIGKVHGIFDKHFAE